MNILTALLGALHPKVKAGAAAGALVAVLVAALAAFGINLPVDVVSALTVLVSAAAGWLKSAGHNPAPVTADAVQDDLKRVAE